MLLFPAVTQRTLKPPKTWVDQNPKWVLLKGQSVLGEAVGIPMGSLGPFLRGPCSGVGVRAWLTLKTRSLKLCKLLLLSIYVDACTQIGIGYSIEIMACK